jgi:hypothetical protein
MTMTGDNKMWELNTLKPTRFYPHTDKETKEVTFRRLKDRSSGMTYQVNKIMLRRVNWPEGTYLTISMNKNNYKIKYPTGQEEGPYTRSRFVVEISKRVQDQSVVNQILQYLA